MNSKLDISETSQHWIDMINAGNFYFEDRGSYATTYYIVIYKNSFTGPILTMEANCVGYGFAYYKSWFLGRKIPVTVNTFDGEMIQLIKDKFKDFISRTKEQTALNNRIHKRFEKKT